MALKVGINGFGRIGRLVFRAACGRKDIEIVGINDLLDANYMAYMLKYDTVHGRFKGTVAVENGKLVVNGKAIRVTAEKDPANLKWNEVGAEYVSNQPGFSLTKKRQARISRQVQKGLFSRLRPKMTRRCSSWASITKHTMAKRSFPMRHARQTALLRLQKLSMTIGVCLKVS